MVVGYMFYEDFCDSTRNCSEQQKIKKHVLLNAGAFSIRENSPKISKFIIEHFETTFQSDPNGRLRTPLPVKDSRDLSGTTTKIYRR